HTRFSRDWSSDVCSSDLQFLKYKRTDFRKFQRSVIVSSIVAAVVSAIFIWVTGVYEKLNYILLSYAATFSIVANARILGDALKRSEERRVGKGCGCWW